MAPDSRSGRRKTMSVSKANGSATNDGDMDGNSQPRLRLEPQDRIVPDSYEDIVSDFHPAIYSHLERHLPSHMLNQPKEVKLHYINHILSRYSSRGERNRVLWQKDYREKIRNAYQPLYKELYAMNPEYFFVQSFLDAIHENTKEGFQRIVTEETPGLYIFDMFQEGFCQSLMKEVENFEKWVDAVNLHIVRPNTMNKYGVVLDDFGFEGMLNELMLKFVKPLASVLFPDVGGATLDSHHGFVVEYSREKDIDLGL
eukprot:TRINITY_DN3144_c0_g1_i3.p1 TRINITY_DN3144_c0_g1~~TRINITY_DN3144_c0_g1_i3.p1  ORF type:complete len:256 (+),score=45.41 TRINITY_DN3144_c0_g1_i3:305-1072(+)